MRHAWLVSWKRMGVRHGVGPFVLQDESPGKGGTYNKRACRSSEIRAITPARAAFTNLNAEFGRDDARFTEEYL